MPADNSLLSRQPIPVHERLIFALDVPSVDEAERLVEDLGESVHFYKLGLQLLMTEGYFPFIERLHRRGKKVFADLKFFDVPQTVAAAVKQLPGRGVTFATVHGNDRILAAACEVKGDVKILAVTLLTSLDEKDMGDLGFKTDPESLVLSRARRALEIGCDGVISSGLELRSLRREVSDGLLLVVPGIRPVVNRVVDDQKRTVDVEEAFLNGADYIVVGRPIRNAVDPKEAAEGIQRRIASLFGDSVSGG